MDLFKYSVTSFLLSLLALLVLVLTGSTTLSCAQENRGSSVLNESGLIDVHAHIGEFRGYDLSLKNLLLNLKENHVQYAFISNIDGAAIPGVTADGDEVAVNMETAKVVAEHKELKPLVWAKPGAKAASANNVEPFLRDKKFFGIKFHPDFNNFSLQDATLTPYLQLCEKYKVPALFHCGPSSRSNAIALYELAKRFPKVPFVFYHMGFNTEHEEAIAVARSAKMKKDAIIYLETAQADTDAVLMAVKMVGAERVIFGTDATYFGRYHYEFYLPMLQELKKALSTAEYQAIIHGNAVELFRLEEKK